MFLSISLSLSLSISRYRSCHSYLPDFACVSLRRYRHLKVGELKDT